MSCPSLPNRFCASRFCGIPIGRCSSTVFAVIPRQMRIIHGGDRMAEHSEVAYTTADGNDYPAHEQTYEGFIVLVKYGTAFVVFIVAMMAVFLT